MCPICQHHGGGVSPHSGGGISQRRRNFSTTEESLHTRVERKKVNLGDRTIYEELRERAICEEFVDRAITMGDTGADMTGAWAPALPMTKAEAGRPGGAVYAPTSASDNAPFSLRPCMSNDLVTSGIGDCPSVSTKPSYASSALPTRGREQCRHSTQGSERDQSMRPN